MECISYYLIFIIILSGIVLGIDIVKHKNGFSNISQIIVVIMERETGIEPAASSLGSLRSTTELLPLAETIYR